MEEKATDRDGGDSAQEIEAAARAAGAYRAAAAAKDVEHGRGLRLQAQGSRIDQPR